MRDILHCDLNNFYASCECLVNPELKDKAVAVGGNPKDRHGVIVAANYKAKEHGVKCGVTVYQALKLCPDIVICTPNFSLYNELSRKVRDIYEQFTDQVEVFSIDECWLDVTNSKIFGSPKEIADKIRQRVRDEIGLTISVGVSFNKTFAKIGSDLKKPDATTVISTENYKQIVWNLPISYMFGIGKKMVDKLQNLGIYTIENLANFNKNILIQQFGKVGEDLYNKANAIGGDDVAFVGEVQAPKSIGNSTTFYKDLTSRRDIELGFTVLAESVVARMIKHDIEYAKTLSITIRDSDLNFYQKQCKLPSPCRDSAIFADTAIKLYYSAFKSIEKVRLLGISVCDFCKDDCQQISMFDNEKKRASIDNVMLDIRKKYGHNSLIRANSLLDDKIANTFDSERVDKS